MFDVDGLVSECLGSLTEAETLLAIRDVLDGALAERVALAEAMGPPAAGLRVLHRSAELTVLNVVWPPRMTLYPHDHRMWAAIGIYGGQEDNAFYRRDSSTIVASGTKQLQEGDVVLLGDDTIHSVHNPAPRYTGALHVYGGDFFAVPRSQWVPDEYAEEPYDIDAVQREFERAERAAASP
jgi:predicted metal-dependent enzyme (double-stranded beta helix superfamily)